LSNNVISQHLSEIVEPRANQVHVFICEYNHVVIRWVHRYGLIIPSPNHTR